MKIAVVGSGISGLSAAWLLSKRHEVTLYEKDARLGGHSNTVDVPAMGGSSASTGMTAVDTGFIVFNPKNYPNLIALFDHLGVETAPSDMSFAVSLDGGRLEYGGSSANSLFAQRRNLANPRFWSMLRDLVRFYRTAASDLGGRANDEVTLGDFLKTAGYGPAFTNDHLLPMAGAIWSAAPETLKSYPAAAFIRFFDNHGLLNLTNRPPWRTVAGGSRTYVSKLAAAMPGRVRPGAAVRSIRRDGAGVSVEAEGVEETFDRILIATHADQALALLADPSERERRVLSAFRYTRNLTVLHTDASLMPRRPAVWSSWNYIGRRDTPNADVCVTYWMNRLQPLGSAQNIFVTLNPSRAPAREKTIFSEVYEHPAFTLEALRAQPLLHALQGDRNTWFCGAYFGAGFHEDGLKSGLDAAEAMGGAARPWNTTGAARPWETTSAAHTVQRDVCEAAI